jgi:DNA helicase-2/ATP-dependent DNA helicase PcrA
VKYGDKQFIDKSHIKDLVAILRAAFFPSDIVSWYRTLNMLERIGPRTTAKLIDSMAESKTGFKILKKYKGKSFAPGLKRIFNFLSSISKEDSSKIIFKKALNYYKPFLKRKFDRERIKPEKRKEKMDDLKALGDFLKEYKNMKNYLNNISLDPPDPRDKKHEKVVLSTIHSAKGLEWNTVFLIRAIRPLHYRHRIFIYSLFRINYTSGGYNNQCSYRETNRCSQNSFYFHSLFLLSI